MANYKVDVSKPAENDLYDIICYISVQLSAPMAALKMAEIIEEALTGLTEKPYNYPQVADERLASMGYRKLIVKNYIVFFTINKKTNVVDIERILYARRDWLHIL
jgi:plasmid stabilization system protein ParE